MKTDSENKKRTDISEVGKVALTSNLLAKAGSTISSSVIFGKEGDYIWDNSHTIMLEGIDFDLTYMPIKYLGYKSVILNLGHLYSKFFKPDNISIRIGLSGRFSVEDVEELWDGMIAAFSEHKIEKISLELQPSLTGLTISSSSQGKQQRELFVQRREPRSGDLIALSGNVGAAFMGLQLLEREKRLFTRTSAQPNLENHKFILKAYLNPEINTSLFDEFENTSISPLYGEFLNTGLADAVKMACHTTGFGAKLFLDRIPIAAQTSAMAQELNMDPITAALNGGNDVQFIFILPIEEYEKISKELPQLDIVGHLCSPEVGAVLVTPDGNSLELKAQGWSEGVA